MNRKRQYERGITMKKTTQNKLLLLVEALAFVILACVYGVAMVYEIAPGWLERTMARLGIPNILRLLYLVGGPALVVGLVASWMRSRLYRDKNSSAERGG